MTPLKLLKGFGSTFGTNNLHGIYIKIVSGVWIPSKSMAVWLVANYRTYGEIIVVTRGSYAPEFPTWTSEAV
jgi:hypothetical protein